MSVLYRKEVMERLRAHPLFKKAIANVSEAEQKHIESIVEDFVDKFAGSLASAASKPGFSQGLKDVASGKAPASGSAG